MTDRAGNYLSGLSTRTLVYDGLRPQALLRSTGVIINDTTLTVEAFFLEPVRGFELSDLTVSNATLTDFVALSSELYQFSLRPTGGLSTNLIRVSLPQDRLLDRADNQNTTSNELVIYYDSLPPRIRVLSSTGINLTNSRTYVVDSRFAGFNDFTGLILTSSKTNQQIQVSSDRVIFEIIGAAGEAVHLSTNYVLVNGASRSSQTLHGVSYSTGGILVNSTQVLIASIDVSSIQDSELDAANAGRIKRDITLRITAYDMVGNTASTLRMLSKDLVEPYVSTQYLATYTPVSSPTNASTFSVTYVMSERADDFTTRDIVITGTGSSPQARVSTVLNTEDTTYVVYFDTGIADESSGRVNLLLPS